MKWQLTHKLPSYSLPSDKVEKWVRMIYAGKEINANFLQKILVSVVLRKVRKLLSLSTISDPLTVPIQHQEAGSILLCPDCQSRVISYRVWVVVWKPDLRDIFGYAVGNADCSDAFWHTLWLIEYLSTVCGRGALSWFSQRYYLSFKSQERQLRLHLLPMP